MIHINLTSNKRVWKLSLAKSAVSPKSAKLPGEPWRARFRKSVTNIELNLGWDHVLMSQ